ncbi:FUSC family protein, partial [Mesorhizobium japonicum]|uniref:FUSC family protein n=1 Tax=Mesorhizobium japonicum TaxID=2066070 RepID=UPI003B5BFB47
RRIRLLPPRPEVLQRVAPAPAPRAEGASRKLTATDRLAIQMGLALALGFAIGLLFFGDRWAWIVLTVVVVAIGNAGRADVLYKGLQRVVGAAIGTLLALVPVAHLGPPTLGVVAALLGVVFVALVLREFGYIWWALFFTLALALVQGWSYGGFLLGERLEEILLGSVLALAVAWLVLPVRSEGTVRR